MYTFGRRSLIKLNTCHPDLIRLGVEAIATSRVDFSCTEGERSNAMQAVHVKAGRSKVEWSLHQERPSLAVHFEPYPLLYPADNPPFVMEDVKRYARYYMLSVHIMAIADRLGIKLRGGQDWDQDADIRDQTFDDLAHYELIQ